MNILCWNCWGLGNPRTIHFLKHLLEAHNNPLFVLLYETKCNKAFMNSIRVSF